MEADKRELGKPDIPHLSLDPESCIEDFEANVDQHGQKIQNDSTNICHAVKIWKELEQTYMDYEFTAILEK